jgi:outer membrane protein TolC
MTKRWLPAAVLAFFGTLHAQETYRFTVKEAMDYAAENSYTVRVQDQEVIKARAILRQNIGLGLPQVNASLGYTWNIEVPTTPVPAEIAGGTPGEYVGLQFGVPHGNNAALSVDQLLIDGSYVLAIVGGKVLNEITQANLEKAEIDVKNLTAQSYFAIRVAEASLDILEDNIAYFDSNLVETKAQFEAGFAEEVSVDQVEILLSDLQNRKNRTQRELDIARQVFNFTLGLPLDAKVELTDDIETVMGLATEAGTVLSQPFEVKDNIEFRILEGQRKASKVKLQNEWIQYAPKVYANFLWGGNGFNNQFNAFDFNTNWFPYSSLGFKISMPLFTGLTRQSKVQEAQVEMRQAEIAQVQTAEQLKISHSRAQNRYAFAIDNYQTQKKNLERASKIRNRERIKFNEGISSSLELTTAQNQYLDSFANTISAANEVMNARTELEKILGNYNRN